ncbi:hypothetical protein OAK75_13930, partial [Bacteriovoracales bacterium]|nr:hypothetical protein [Bacteriovoracales bacterium]
MLLTLGLTLYSCGPQKVYQTGIKFNSTAYALSGNAQGGLILVGESNGQYFSTNLTLNDDSSTTLFLPAGNWNFYSMAWDGSSNFTGTTRCASGSGTYNIPNDSNNNIPVSFSLTTSKCNSDAFAASVFTDSSSAIKIPKLRLISCSELDGVSNNTSACNSPLSKLGSNSFYKISMGNIRSDGLGDLALSPLESACLPASGSFSEAESVISTNLRIGLMPTSAFGVEVKAYSDSSCSNHEVTYSFPRGFGQGGASSTIYAFSDSQARNSVYLADNYTGFGSSALSSQVPAISCNSGHCIPGATAAPEIGRLYYGAKTILSRLLGTSDAKDPEDASSDRRYLGAIDQAGFFLSGPIGTLLKQKSIASCQSSPSSDSPTDYIAQVGPGKYVKINFHTPKKTLPTHYTGGSGGDRKFERRVSASLGTSPSGPWQLVLLSEFNCTSDYSKVGWLRQKDEDGSQVKEMELWYDTSQQNQAKAELYGYEKHTEDGASYPSKWRYIVKFNQTSSTEYTAWITGSEFKETSDGIRNYVANSNYTFGTPYLSVCYNLSDGSATSCSLGSGNNPSNNPIRVNNLSTNSLNDGNSEGWSALSSFSTSDSGSSVSSGSSSSGHYDNMMRLLVKGTIGSPSTMNVGYYAHNRTCTFPSSLNSSNYIAAWLKAGTNMTLDGTSVVSWGDNFSDSSDDIISQSNSGKRPIYNAQGMSGQPTVYFDGEEDFLSGQTFANNIGQALNGQSGYTLFIAASPQTINGSNASRVMLYMGTSGTPKIRAYLNNSNKYQIHTRPRGHTTQRVSNNSNEAITSNAIFISKTDFANNSVNLFGNISGSTTNMNFGESSWDYTSGNSDFRLTIGMHYGNNNNPKYFKGHIG